MKKPWQIFASKLSDKLLDTGNIVFGALIVGQFLGGQPFNWRIALTGFGVWIGFHLLSFFAVLWSGEGD